MAGKLTAGAEAIRLLDALRAAGARHALHLAPDEARAATIARFLAAAAPGIRVVLVPGWDCLPYDWASPSVAAMGRRMAALAALAHHGPTLAVAAPGGLLQRTVPPEAAPARTLRTGERLDEPEFLAWCAAAGYRDDERVDEPGEVALRGTVIDLFPAGDDRPLRLALEDGRIASIRPFDPVTQRTDGARDEARIHAATEMPDGAAAERGAEHWLPDRRDDLVPLAAHLDDPALFATPAALDAADRFLAALAPARDERHRAEVDGGGHWRPLAPAALYLAEAEWAALRDRAAALPDDGAEAPPAIAAAPRPRRALREAADGAGRLVLLAASPRERRRLARMLPDGAAEAGGWDDLPERGAAALVAPLDHGFRDGGTLVLTARDVLGQRAEDAGGTTTIPPWLLEAQDLHHGDLVVHEDHGLGRLDGLEAVEGGEAIRVAYADDKTLLVPVADAGLLWRYGHDEGEAALDRLGGAAWTKRRAGLARTLDRTAAALVERARAREAAEAPAIEPDRALLETVAARFGWEPTPDQRAAIDAVLRDLGETRPMRRILVGDVGFGKTEVAIRAVAAALGAGRQVAVVAPTTVLARQHAATFARRLEGTGFAVETLSRLQTAGEARRVRDGLADGTVRLVVGTHAVLSDATAFHDLGLVVLDEEQRFGAREKRRVEELARDVHTLTMTATPIPRSLQGAVAGLQELSLLHTAPARRRPIRTAVAADDPGLLGGALEREWRRGGQSFVVVPRVEAIEGVAGRIREAAPRLRLRVAHGDLPAAEIDAAMTGFAAGAGDVLLATAIIESGLDVPRANTMIVLRPELFGMAQLHQLRGRVGRGAEQAYCWLLTDPDAPPEGGARRRLAALEAMDTLGAGFALSVADLDRRGAGDLLSDEQTGHGAHLGPALHAELLAAALRRAKGEGEPTRPELKVDAAMRLPEGYVPRDDVRATLYNRLARARTPEAAGRLADEVEDRFGPPPPEARLLLDLARLRAEAAALGVAEVSAGPEAVALRFAEGRAPEAAPDGLEAKGGRLLLRRALPDAAARVAAALEMVERLGA